jgi:hypothetical protein
MNKNKYFYILDIIGILIIFLLSHCFLLMSIKISIICAILAFLLWNILFILINKHKFDNLIK